MLLGRWFADDMTAVEYPVFIKLEALLRRYSWKKVLQNYSRISYGAPGWSEHEPESGAQQVAAAC
jgi:hypothetical protein